MPLESLLQLVETLKGRIEIHRDVLSRSEMLTRYALIDPLLRELGWDTSDPTMVIPEYRSGSGSADYALVSDGRPAMMIEAKKLGTRLQDASGQGIQYCLIEGTPYFTLTDGGRWEIYETHRPVPIDEKRAVEFDLMNQSTAEVCLKALALWRASVQSGRAVAAQQPILVPKDGPSPPPVPPPYEDGDGWTSLSDLDPGLGSAPPSEIAFPDGSHSSIRYWADIPAEAARWLTENRILTAAHCPIHSPSVRNRSTRHLLATSPSHPDGGHMRSREVNNLYLGINYRASDQVRNTRVIINHVGQDPAQFKVRFG